MRRERMKKKHIKIICAISFCLLLVAQSSVIAQQRYSDQWIFMGSGGINTSAGGYYAGLGIEKILSNPASSIQAQVLFNNSKYKAGNHSTFIQNYYVMVDYAYTFFAKTATRLSMIGGGFIGQQDFNSVIAPGIEITATPGFIYGINIAAQIDAVISKNLSVFLQPMIIYDFGTEIDDFSVLTGIGIKYYF